MRPRLTVVDDPSPELRAAIDEPLIRFNDERTGGSYDHQLLVIALANPDTGHPVGGLWGSTARRHLFIELLYVPTEFRSIGLGRDLVLMAEEEARRRGCVGAWLDTYSFQALGFYKRLGYSEFGIIDDYPPGHSRHFLRKVL